MYARAGLIRMQASEQGVRKSNEEIKRVTIGLLGILSLFVIIYTFNRDILRGDVGLDAFRTGISSGGGLLSNVVTGGSSSGVSRACGSTDAVIQSLSSQQGLCGNAQCTALSGCNYQPYKNIIQTEASRAGVDPNLVIVFMCQESKGKAGDSNRNPNGTYDCGLMQVNQTGTCDATSLDPTTNIRNGIQKIKQFSSARIYPSIPQAASIAASYNSGPAYNNPSVDCTAQNGFPQGGIPKWVCPINPGDGQFNMCVVKNYACGVSACMDALSGKDL